MQSLRNQTSIKHHLIFSEKFSTVTKTRFVFSNQQIIRIDEEIPASDNDDIDSQLIDVVEKRIQVFRSIILLDYRKGVLDKQFVNYVLAIGPLFM